MCECVCVFVYNKYYTHILYTEDCVADRNSCANNFHYALPT